MLRVPAYPEEVALKSSSPAAVAIACAILIACSGEAPGVAAADGGAGPGPSGSPGVGGLPCDVDAVLAKGCRTCHGATPAFGAPMPLASLADLRADSKAYPGKKVFERVGARIHDDASPMPQPPNPRLPSADAAVLDRWIAAGAPAGTEACAAPTPNPGGVTPLACNADQRVRPASRFAMTNATDLYVCYGFDTTAAQRRHVIAGAPHIDNPKIVHHVLLYQAEAAVSATPQPCGAGGGRDWRLVTGWAPGGRNFELPPEAGFAEEAGTTHWAIQIHYNNAQGLVGETDASGYDLCTTDQLRPNDADIMATGTMQIDIPPRSTFTTTCDLAYPSSYGPIKVLSAWAHMHRLGRAEYAKRMRGGQDAMLLDVPAYDFSVGAGATSVNVDLGPGDTIQTMCQWRNDTDAAVRFGEGTGDEMCFAFLTYYPKITAPRFRWSSPSSPLVSRCTTKTE